jgi:hypothetical protein
MATKTLRRPRRPVRRQDKARRWPEPAPITGHEPPDVFADRVEERHRQREVLHAMSPQERLVAYRRGDLSAFQRHFWWNHYPEEVPRINDVVEWIAVTLADICEHPEYEERCRQARARGLRGQPR